MNKPLGFNNIKALRENIIKYINEKISKKIENKNSFDFVEDSISIKTIDYYYTNPIARASKIMNECRTISKNLSFTGIEKAS